MQCETLSLAVNLLDRSLVIMNGKITKNNLQLLGVSCLFVAAKFEEIFLPNTEDFVLVAAKVFTKEEIYRMEQQVFYKYFIFIISIYLDISHSELRSWSTAQHPIFAPLSILHQSGATCLQFRQIYLRGGPCLIRTGPLSTINSCCCRNVAGLVHIWPNSDITNCV